MRVSLLSLKGIGDGRTHFGIFSKEISEVINHFAVKKVIVLNVPLFDGFLSLKVLPESLSQVHFVGVGCAPPWRRRANPWLLKGYSKV
jgi:hypothetical protein